MNNQPIIYAVSVDAAPNDLAAILYGTVTAYEQVGYKFVQIQNRNGDVLNVDFDSLPALIAALQKAKGQLSA